MSRTLYNLWLRLLPLQLIVIIGSVGMIMGVTVGLLIALLNGGIERIPLSAGNSPRTVATAEPPPAMSQVFTPEVQYWKPWILKWSQQYGVDANILATVIQIESCGQYMVGSSAGAQGLFQVMPFHFEEGEDMKDPDTNALRGITYLKGGLALADGHIGLAMAGYNGGWGVIDWGWAGWYDETRRYYVWGSGIYQDALLNKTTADSAILQDWLNAGGSRLCAQAHAILFPATAVPSATP